MPLLQESAEGATVHILIIAADAERADALWAPLRGMASRCTLTTSWADARATLTRDAPDIVVAERAALSSLTPEERAELTDAQRWPVTVLVDQGAVEASAALVAAERVVRVSAATIQIGELQIDTLQKRARLCSPWVWLPPLEFRLLLTLAQRAGEVIGHRELIQAVWGYDAGDNEARELLKVHIHHIRQRLGLTHHSDRYIRAVRGFGYMLAPPDE